MTEFCLTRNPDNAGKSRTKRRWAPGLLFGFPMKTHHFHCEQFLPLTREEVFPFFADAFNLERITPPFLKFRVTTPPPIEMGVGTLIDYRLKIHGLPIRWRTEITAWEPPFRFVDEQLRGPYRLWRHEHTFEPCEGGTLCRDHVEYAHFGGSLVHRFLVRPDVEQIFAHRRVALEALLAPPTDA